MKGVERPTAIVGSRCYSAVNCILHTVFPTTPLTSMVQTAPFGKSSAPEVRLPVEPGSTNLVSQPPRRSDGLPYHDRYSVTYSYLSVAAKTDAAAKTKTAVFTTGSCATQAGGRREASYVQEASATSSIVYAACFCT